jgi:hypothetical protein
MAGAAQGPTRAVPRVQARLHAYRPDRRPHGVLPHRLRRIIWDGWVFPVSGGNIALIVGEDAFWRVTFHYRGDYYAEARPADLPSAEALRPHIVHYIAWHL